MLSETKIENMMREFSCSYFHNLETTETLDLFPVPIFPTIASPLPLGYTLNSMSAEVCV
jgi:hypothetical protein